MKYFLSLMILAGLWGCGSKKIDVILATTTSTQDSGLLDVLVPAFEQQTEYRIKTIAVGTGQALEPGARGEADVVLVHAPDLEMQYVAKGAFSNRRPVMHNDFLLVGPAEDPALIKGMTQAVGAFEKMASSQALFVSRGDRSGTHVLEKKLWKMAQIDPTGPWYLEVGQGMGETLMVGSEKRAYVLTDRATYLAFQDKIHLIPLIEGDVLLRNNYHVMEVNFENFPRVNRHGARAFSDFIVSPQAQAIIAAFGKDKFGSPLFYPDAENEQLKK